MRGKGWGSSSEEALGKQWGGKDLVPRRGKVQGALTSKCVQRLSPLKGLEVQRAGLGKQSLSHDQARSNLDGMRMCRIHLGCLQRQGAGIESGSGGGDGGGTARGTTMSSNHVHQPCPAAWSLPQSPWRGLR
jgi:hypothetical protein